MQENMTIPKKIKVGFQDRSDTYTGKLAYIVYFDEKGVLRKQTSWEGWRDKKIDPQEFANEPTSGFVLNKKVGDYRSSWNHRSAKIRIYDPRGFEFEIPVDNLLYILEECTSTKGKGLEGDFVYAWSGKDLVLLPVSSQEYVTSTEFTSLKTMKVAKKDVVEGCMYMSKDTKKLLYLGDEEVFDSEGYPWGSRYGRKSIGKKKVFLDTESNDYVIYDGFVKLAKRLTDTVSGNYADEYDKFKKSAKGSIFTKIIFVPSKPIVASTQYGIESAFYNCRETHVKYNGEYYKKNHITGKFKYNSTFYYSYQPHNRHKVEDFIGYEIELYKINFENGIISHSSELKILMTKEQIEALETFTVELENDFGTRIKLT